MHIVDRHVSKSFGEYILLDTCNETCIKNNTFKMIFYIHHADLCRTVTHFIIVAHLSLSRITDMHFTMGIRPSFCQHQTIIREKECAFLFEQFEHC